MWENGVKRNFSGILIHEGITKKYQEDREADYVHHMPREQGRVWRVSCSPVDQQKRGTDPIGTLAAQLPTDSVEGTKQKCKGVYPF
jgi:hypothetical protein